MGANIPVEHDWRTVLMSLLTVKPGGMLESRNYPRSLQRKLSEAKGNYKFWIALFISALSQAPLLYSSSLVLQERDESNKYAKMTCYGHVAELLLRDKPRNVQ